MNKRNIIIIISILAFIVIVGGISYSYFVYNKDVGTVTLNTGEISLNLSNESSSEIFTGVIPQTDNEGKASTNYFDFTVNSTVDTEKIYYEIYILPKSGNTLDTSYLKTYLTDQSDVEIKDVTLYDSLSEGEVEDGKVIYKDVVELNNNYTSKTETKDFRLRLWLDETYQETTSKTFEFDIYVYGKNVPESFSLPKPAFSVINNVLQTKSNVTTAQDAEGVVFLKGTEEDIDFNYVWYSGKLWRIVALYPNETIKLVTENPMTSIYWGNNVNFNGSFVDQWLSQEFLPTLYNNSNIVVQNAEWNVTRTTAITDPYQISNPTIINKIVGLLNTYEYTQTRPSSGKSYLSVGIDWRLMNAYNSSNVRYVDVNGNVNYTSISLNGIAVRPSIILQSKVKFNDGDGTRDNPYKIEGDIEVANTNANLNTRISGEYVSINNELYRIVEIDNNITKVVKTDYIINPYSDQSDNTTCKFGTDVYYNTTSNNLIYWDDYLKDSTNGWLSTQGAPNTSLLVNGTFYQGPSEDGSNYKSVICATVDASTSSSACTPISGENTSYTGLVGLLRVGEMHSAQQSTISHFDSNSSYKTMWLISPYLSSTGNSVNVLYLDASSHMGNISPSNYAESVRPAIYLSSSVIILSGNGMVTNPYIVGLPS